MCYPIFAFHSLRVVSWTVAIKLLPMYISGYHRQMLGDHQSESSLFATGYSKPHSPALSRALRSRPQDYLTGAACRFCERIIPVQLTCGLTAQALKGAAARIAALHSREVVQAAAGSPIKLAGRGSSGPGQPMQDIAV